MVSQFFYVLAMLLTAFIFSCGRKEIEVSNPSVSGAGYTPAPIVEAPVTSTGGETAAPASTGDHPAFVPSQMDKYYSLAAACSQFKPGAALPFPQEEAVLLDYTFANKPTVQLPMPFSTATLYTDAKWQYVAEKTPPVYRFTFTVLIGELTQVDATDPQHWHFPYKETVEYEHDGTHTADLQPRFFLGAVDLGLGGEGCSFTLTYKPSGI